MILARHYGTTIEEIQRANGLKSIALRQGVVYRIPQKSAPKAGPRGPSRPAAPPRRSASNGTRGQSSPRR